MLVILQHCYAMSARRGLIKIRSNVSSARLAGTGSCLVLSLQCHPDRQQANSISPRPR